MSVADNLTILQEKIDAVARGASRVPADIELVAVSKKQPDERIDAALQAGHRIFGENRVQEAQGRWSHRREDYADLKLHLVGPLQSNKASDAVALFDVIETVDREKIARALAKEMEKQDRHLPCYIQVNTGEEEQKSGVFPEDVADFHRLCSDECGLNIVGLMCIPPVDEPPALHFALLHDIARRLNLPKLSMGMSSDYEKAIALGATSVRVGTAVFGAREGL